MPTCTNCGQEYATHPLWQDNDLCNDCQPTLTADRLKDMLDKLGPPPLPPGTIAFTGIRFNERDINGDIFTPETQINLDGADIPIIQHDSVPDETIYIVPRERLEWPKLDFSGFEKTMDEVRWRMEEAAQAMYASFGIPSHYFTDEPRFREWDQQIGETFLEWNDYLRTHNLLDDPDNRWAYTCAIWAIIWEKIERIFRR